MRKSETFWDRVEWPSFLFFTLYPIALIAVLATGMLKLSEVSLGIWVAAFVFWWIGGIGITAGYHRLFSHQTYDAPRWVQWVLIFMGSGTFQGSCLDWASGHRKHHMYTDRSGDPYNINKSFWWAHMGWIVMKPDKGVKDIRFPDLEKDPMIQFQHKYYIPIAVAMCFGAPALVGWFLGDAFGGLMIAGFLRLLIMHQGTFLVNSGCHYWGTRPYAEHHTARNSHLMALPTFGEGYHNFHHRFPHDYRNGINWYDYDPGKWFLDALSAVGLAVNLKKASDYEIVKARMDLLKKKLVKKGSWSENYEAMKSKIEAQLEYRKRLLEEYRQEKTRALRQEMRQARREFRRLYARWKIEVAPLAA